MPNWPIEELIRINVLSPIALTKYVVRNMMVGPRGSDREHDSIMASTGYNALSVYSPPRRPVGFTRRSPARSARSASP